MGEFWRLVGATLLGALISFGTTFYFERRKEQRAERADQQETERQLLQARRLIFDELNNAWIVINWTTDTQFWWSNPPYDLESLAWDDNQATLARLLDEDTWTAVRIAYSSIAEFNMRLAMGREGKEVPSPTLEMEEGFEPILEPIQGKFATDPWIIELQSLYEGVDRAMELLAREESNTKPHQKRRPKRLDTGNKQKS